MAAVVVEQINGNGQTRKDSTKVKEFLVVGNKASRNINNFLQNGSENKESKNITLKHLNDPVSKREKILEVDTAVMSIVTRYVSCRAILGDAADVVLQDALDRLDMLSLQIQDGSDKNSGNLLKKRKSVLLKKLQENAFKQKAEATGVFLNYKMEFVVGLVPACFDKQGKLKTECSYRWTFSTVKTLMEPCPPAHKKAETILHFGQLRVRNLGEQAIKSYSVYIEGDNLNSVLIILGSRRRPKKGSIDIQLVPPVEFSQQNVTAAHAGVSSTTDTTSVSGSTTGTTGTTGKDESTDTSPRVFCSRARTPRKKGILQTLSLWWKKGKGDIKSESSCSCTPTNSISTSSENPPKVCKLDAVKPTAIGDSNQSLGVASY